MSSKSNRAASAMATLATLTLVVSGGAQAADTGMDMKKGANMEMHQSMMKGMKDMESMPMSGDTDRDFAMMMKMHHQGALDMAQAELNNGKDAKMRGMAKNIIASQKKEIKQFDDWLAKHKEPMSHSMMEQE